MVVHGLQWKEVKVLVWVTLGKEYGKYNMHMMILK